MNANYMPKQRLLELCKRSVATPDRSKPWEWLERNITSIPYSPKGGKFTTSHTRWMRAPLEAIADDSIKLVMMLASVQSSKSLILHGALNWIIKNKPGQTLYILNTDEEARDESETRLQRLFESTPPIKELYNTNRHKNKTQSILFRNGMQLNVLGQESPNNLQRRSIRWLFLDETWLFKKGSISEARARTTAYGRLGKTILASQGSEEGDDTDRLWKLTNQAHWNYKCPNCGKHHEYKFENLEWSKDSKDDEGNWNWKDVKDSTALKCPTCGIYHEDTERKRYELNKNGCYVATYEGAEQENHGYHWNGMCALPWGKLAVQYLQAKQAMKRGEVEPMRIFQQKRMGKPWSESLDDYKMEVPEDAGFTLGESEWEQCGYIDINKQLTSDATLGIVRLCVMSIDVQMDCFYYVVRLLSIDGMSRLINCGRVSFWEDLKAVQEKHEIHPAFVFVDSGFGKKGEVYEQCALNAWTALKGDGMRDRFSHTQPNGKKIFKFYSELTKAGTPSGKVAKLHHYSNLNVKDILDRLKRYPDKWQVPPDVPEEYLKSLESEKRIRTRSGQWRWEQQGKRANHYWDCEVMITAAMLMLKVLGQESIEAEDTSAG